MINIRNKGDGIHFTSTVDYSWTFQSTFFIHCCAVERYVRGLDNRNMLRLDVLPLETISRVSKNRNTIKNCARSRHLSPSSTHTRGLILLFRKYIDIMCCVRRRSEARKQKHVSTKERGIFFINDKNIHLTHGLPLRRRFRVVFVALFMSFHSWYLMLSHVALAGVRWCGVKVHSHPTVCHF